MEKIFQPIVKEQAGEMILSLEESGFFKEYEIVDMGFVKEYLCEKLTEKFIAGVLDSDEPLFNEPEFNTLLQEIIAGSILSQLKGKGYINSYSDDNTKEVFFLTDDGKEYIKNKIKNDDPVI